MQISFLLFELILFALEVALKPDIILVELILSEEVLSDSFIETLNFDLLRLAIFFFPSDDFIALD